MKTFQITNAIGTLCILFGAQQLLTGTAIVVMSAMQHESPPIASADELNWSEWMGVWRHVGLLVSLTYLLAGVFFLLKKSFSLRLMYTALILSLLSSFGMVLLLSMRPGGGYPWRIISVFFLIGPAIDVLMLISVYRIRRFYFTEPDREVYFFGNGVLSNGTLKGISISGLLLVLAPLSMFLLWLYIANMDIANSEKVAKFQGYFPTLLQARYATSYLGLFTAGAAFVMSSLGLRLQEKPWQRLNTMVMILSLLMGMVNLWSMM